MNFNENGPKHNIIKNRGRQLKAVPIQRTLMGPPKRPAPKRKASTSSAYITSNSSNIQWKSQQKNSICNNSTTVHTASTSRSRSSTNPESRIVLALSEGRGEAIGEVGIAAINIAHPSLILCQISDSQSYINTLTKINILNPSEILIPLTFIESFSSNRLIEKVKEKFHDIKITGVPRSSFNKTNGLQYIKQLCVPSMNSILLVLQHRYYALAAAAALLTYTETTLFIIYANESIKIEYQESEGSTIIDVATADGLELVASARPSMKKRFSCLLDVLNYCITKIGTRTLRATILQPSCFVPDIEARLDCITELLEHTDLLAAVQASLMKLSNIDQLLSLATILPDQAQNCSERQLNYVLILNTALEQIMSLKDIIENLRQPFFIELRNTLNNPVFTDIKNLVRGLIHSDAYPAKGQYGIIQRCFAIKSGLNSLLDLLRKSYSERLDDMREYVKTLGEKHNLALTLNNTHKKGYHILLTLNAHQKRSLKKSDLPSEFIQVERLPTCYTMKTQDLINLSHRVEDMMLEILKMSNIMIFRLLIQIREQVGVFYKLCDDIAYLDMLQSLAKASSAIHYVRPKFSDYLEIEQARHPLLDFLCSTEPTANSVFASKEHNMNIITGPNGSGKSIFIRQIVLLQVMAQVGCYVPAHSATLRVSDRILAKVYLEDNMDCGASAFVLEMKEIQYFFNVLTDSSLIVIDELCRSTSVEEGTALAMAVCEKLMKIPAFLFFTTHFKFMTKLQDLHYNVKTWQLETLTEVIDDQMILRFTYNVIPGVTSLEHYGIFLAKTSWPDNIIKYAENILQKLAKSQKKSCSCVNNVNEAAHLKYNLEAEFKMLKAKNQLIQSVINEKLAEYQKKLEDLGHQTDQVYVASLDNQKNTNHISETNDDVQTEDLSQLLNNQAQITNIVRQTNGFQGFDFNSAENQQIFKDINENSYQNFRNQCASFNNVFVENSDSLCASMDQECNFGNNFSKNLYDIKNDNRQINKEISSRNIKATQYFKDFGENTNNTKFGLFDQHTIDNGKNVSENLHSVSQNSFGIFEGLGDLENCSFNVFEPEVILQTTTNNLEINLTNVQKDTITIHQVTENDLPFHSVHSSLNHSFVTQHVNTSIREHREIIREHESLSISNKMCEDGMNEFNNDRYINQLNDTESILSANEHQFSLPLQQNLERTSTPLQTSFTQRSFDENVNSQMSEDELKSINSNTAKSFSLESEGQTNSVPARLSDLESNLENIEAEHITKSQSDSNGIKCKTKLNSASTNTIDWGVGKFQNINFTSTRSNQFQDTASHALTSNDQNLKLVSEIDDNSSRHSSCQNSKQTKSVMTLNSKISNNDSSLASVNNEHQFSLPLQQNNKKTSTPLRVEPRICSEPISHRRQKQTTINSKILNLEMSRQKSKSSPISESIKWNTGKTQHILSTPMTSFATDVNEQSNTVATKSILTLKKLRTNESSNCVLEHIKEKQKNNFLGTNMNTTSEDIELQNLDISISEFISSSKQLQNTNYKYIKGISNNINPKISIHDSSIPLANNEYQFSLPLQQNNKKTSTPLRTNTNIHSESISDFSKQKPVINVYKNMQSQILEQKSKLGKLQNVLETRKTNDNYKKSLTFDKLNDKDESSNTSQNAALHASTSNDQNQRFASENICYNENESLYEPGKQIKITKLRPSHIDSSIASVNSEHRFSLPLQQNNNRTSTPRKANTKIHSEQISSTKKQTVESKSTSTSSSDGINWKVEKLQNILTTTSLLVSNTHQQLYSIPEHSHIPIPQLGPKLQSTDTLKYTNSSTDKTSKFRFKKYFKDKPIEDSANPKDDTQNCNNTSHYYSAEDIIEIINDLQSCSKYFTDEENWETLDEEKDLRLKQTHNNIKSIIQETTADSQANIRKELNAEKNLGSSSENHMHDRQETSTSDLEDNKIKSLKISPLKQNEEIIEIMEETICNTRLSEKNDNVIITKKPEQSDQIKFKNQLINDEETRNTLCNKDIFQSNMVKDDVSHLLEDEVEFLEEIDLESQLENEVCQQHVPQEKPKGKVQQNATENFYSQYIASLDELGDIHLELFSDESIVEEYQSRHSDVIQENKQNENNSLSQNSPKKHNQDDVQTSSQSQRSKEITSQSENNKIIHCQLKDIQNTTNTENPNNPKTSNDTSFELFSDTSIIEASQNQIKIQSLQKIKFDKQKHSTKESPKKGDNYNSNSSPKLKKRKLDYNGSPRSTTILYKEKGSDIDTEAQPSNPFQVSPTASDFEIPEDQVQNSNVSQKKRKWTPPFKTNSDTSTSIKKPSKHRTQKKERNVIPKFKPPQKLTKKEIEREFFEQDKKMLKSTDSAQYIQQLLNRPSVKQLQAAKHIMSIHKTSSGILVVPTKESKPKTRKRKFTTPLKHQMVECDVSLLSDKNSDKYEEFMNSKKKEEIVNVRQDVVYQYNRSEVVRKNSNNQEINNASNKSSEESCFEKFGNAIQNFKIEALNNASATSSINNNEPPEQCKGYYTQNKKRLDDMINKYLNREVTHTLPDTDVSQKSIFSQATVVINED